MAQSYGGGPGRGCRIADWWVGFRIHVCRLGPPLCANSDETVLLVVMTEQGENRIPIAFQDGANVRR